MLFSLRSRGSRDDHRTVDAECTQERFVQRGKGVLMRFKTLPARMVSCQTAQGPIKMLRILRRTPGGAARVSFQMAPLWSLNHAINQR
jgi:hypothetical protein